MKKIFLLHLSIMLIFFSCAEKDSPTESQNEYGIVIIDVAIPDSSELPLITSVEAEIYENNDSLLTILSLEQQSDGRYYGEINLTQGPDRKIIVNAHEGEFIRYQDTDNDIDVISGQSIYAQINLVLRPIAPSNLQAITASSDQINLTWQNNDPYADSLFIERKDSEMGTYLIHSTLNPNSDSYEDNNLLQLHTYYYRVRIHIGSGYSDYSNEVSATTDEIIPSPPNFVEATAISENQINLSWSCGSFTDSIMIERQTSQNGNFIQIAQFDASITDYEPEFDKNCFIW
ncbi:MAG: fibronectin type III domain-containing protein [Deltaproteobacteria bacterium]|nr:fibronectin type III domain-containing protein [Deltaproteobacteria bacterium]